jgi:hypothetical protein
MSEMWKVKTGGAIDGASVLARPYRSIPVGQSCRFATCFVFDLGGAAAPARQKSFPPLNQIAGKRNQPGKFVSRINVFFDDVKGEIIKPAETPHCQHQQDGGLPFRIVQKYQNRRDDSDEQE